VPAVTLTDLDRRTLAHLAIPRSYEDLAAVMIGDRHTPFGPGQREEELAAGRAIQDPSKLPAHVKELIKLGWIVDLGEHAPDQLGKLLAKHVDGYKGAIPLYEDERARNFEAKRSKDDQLWRVNGNLLMLSEEGLEKLREPITPEYSMTPSEVRDLIAKHASAIKDLPVKGSIFDKDGGSLDEKISRKETLTRGVPDPDNPGRAIATLLPEEFRYWESQVIKDTEKRWGVKVPPLIAGGAGYFNATEDLIQAADAGGTAYSETAPTYFALSILAFTDVDTGTTADDGSHITTYTGTARKSATAADIGTSSAGTRTNANAIIWAGATAGSSTVVGVGRFTAASAGRGIRYMTVASTTVSATQTPAQIAAGAMTDTLD
jgi:hypothetical protein